jgi:hypothetical protein
MELSIYAGYVNGFMIDVNDHQQALPHLTFAHP